jgi:hypothetical protein
MYKAITMKRIFYFFFFAPLSAFSQKEDDNLMVVTVSDTTKLYERVRQAIVYTDFIIEEDSGRDTLRTYSERIGRSTIFIAAKIVIVGNKVEISGLQALGYQDFWGEPGRPRSFNRISYNNKGSEEWWRIRSIALKLDGKIEYMKRK